MANVSHASLTGSNLHEPKGADTAALGTVYVSNGAGGGSWNSIGTSAFTGMISDFVAPVPPAGWLELDGSVISTTTFSALYGVMAIQTSGTRTNGNPIITSIPSTATFKAGYFVFGTGINAGTTILSVDSATQITMSAGATSGGSSTFAVSPWAMGSGTITLPDATTAGRYRRSRQTSTKVGDLISDTIKQHSHPLSSSAIATGTPVANHTHANTLTDPGHGHFAKDFGGGSNTHGFISPAANAVATTPVETTTANATTGITINNVAAGGFTPVVTMSGATDNFGFVAETRPLTLVCLTCVKT